MAKATATPEGSEHAGSDTEVQTKTTSKKNATTERKKSVDKDGDAVMEDVPAPEADKEEAEEEVEGEEGGEEDDEEYEIEEILKHRRGMFPEGRMGYFVRWKGYGPQDNSWVDEQDAGNATDLIEEYWSKQPKAKAGGRKSIDKTPKATKGRTSRGKEETPVAEVAETNGKRGRGRAKKDASSDEEEPPRKRGKATAKSEAEEGEGETKGKATKRGRGARKESPPPAESDDPDNVEVITMKKYKDLSSWSKIVQSIETVEKEDDNLLVYMTLISGERAVERSDICAKKLPDKLIAFYESNLRWKGF